jgi:hypothetical protein
MRYYRASEYRTQAAIPRHRVAPRLLDEWSTACKTTYCSECVRTGEGLRTTANGDGSADYVLQYTVRRNLSDPVWTHDDLTFPSTLPYPVR